MDCTNRVEKASERMEKLFGDAPWAVAATDPEFAAIHARLVHGAIDGQGGLSDTERVLVTLATLCAVRATGAIGRATLAGLNLGVEPVAMRESLYQCAPYCGLDCAEAALAAFNATLAENGVALPLPDAGTVTEDSRFADGLAAQKGIFGDGIDTMHKNAPADQRDLIVDHLSAWCFGDFYTRRGLDLPLRELLTFVCVASLGGCEPQVKAHVQGNLNVGNDKAKLLDTLRQMLPHIGYPRTLNALACVNSVCG